jgi:glycosyltransferase involved in cell wall biosynthesis
MNISLVIPSRNNKKYVQYAYNSIRTYIGNDVEIILMDDASTDGTFEFIKENYPDIQIYRNKPVSAEIVVENNVTV